MIKKAMPCDSRVLAELAVQLWNRHTVDALETEFLETMQDERAAFFIQYKTWSISKSGLPLIK